MRSERFAAGQGRAKAPAPAVGGSDVNTALPPLLQPYDGGVGAPIVPAPSDLKRGPGADLSGKAKAKRREALRARARQEYADYDLHDFAAEARRERALAVALEWLEVGIERQTFAHLAAILGVGEEHLLIGIGRGGVPGSFDPDFAYCLAIADRPVGSDLIRPLTDWFFDYQPIDARQEPGLSGFYDVGDIYRARPICERLTYNRDAIWIDLVDQVVVGYRGALSQRHRHDMIVVSGATTELLDPVEIALADVQAAFAESQAATDQDDSALRASAAKSSAAKAAKKAAAAVADSADLAFSIAIDVSGGQDLLAGQPPLQTCQPFVPVWIRQKGKPALIGLYASFLQRFIAVLPMAMPRAAKLQPAFYAALDSQSRLQRLDRDFVERIWRQVSTGNRILEVILRTMAAYLPGEMRACQAALLPFGLAPNALALAASQSLSRAFASECDGLVFRYETEAALHQDPAVQAAMWSLQFSRSLQAQPFGQARFGLSGEPERSKDGQRLPVYPIFLSELVLANQDVEDGGGLALLIHEAARVFVQHVMLQSDVPGTPVQGQAWAALMLAIGREFPAVRQSLSRDVEIYLRNWSLERNRNPEIDMAIAGREAETLTGERLREFCFSDVTASLPVS